MENSITVVIASSLIIIISLIFKLEKNIEKHGSVKAIKDLKQNAIMVPICVTLGLILGTYVASR